MLGSTRFSKPGSLGAGWPKGEKNMLESASTQKSGITPVPPIALASKTIPRKTLPTQKTQPNSEFLLYARNCTYLIYSSQRLDKDFPCRIQKPGETLVLGFLV